MKYAKIHQIGRIKPNESRVNRHNFMDEPNNSKENDNALRNGMRLLSSYRSEGGTTFWIITEAGRSATTLLLPDDY